MFDTQCARPPSPHAQAESDKGPCEYCGVDVHTLCDCPTHTGDPVNVHHYCANGRSLGLFDNNERYCSSCALPYFKQLMKKMSRKKLNDLLQVRQVMRV
jgi:hypothetical protein